jgi:hypothetical protein
MSRVRQASAIVLGLTAAQAEAYATGRRAMISGLLRDACGLP